MRRTLVWFGLLALGCGGPGRRDLPARGDPGPQPVVPAPSTAPAPATRPGPYVIFVGQPYADAQATARAAGYALHDGRHLAWASSDGGVGVDGFYVSLPGDTDLIVFRDGAAGADVVGGLHLVGNASRPKSERTAPPVGDSVELPPPGGDGW